MCVCYFFEQSDVVGVVVVSEVDDAGVVQLVGVLAQPVEAFVPLHDAPGLGPALLARAYHRVVRRQLAQMNMRDFRVVQESVVSAETEKIAETTVETSKYYTWTFCRFSSGCPR